MKKGLAAASAKDSFEEFRSTYVKMLLDTDQLSFFDVYNLEQQGVQCIKNGDVDAAKELFRREFVNGLSSAGTYARQHLKNLEYKCVTCIVINARVAIESGLSIQGAYAIRNSLLQRTAEASTFQEYFDLCYESFMSFTYLIKYSKSVTSEDGRINQIREYIHNNIAAPLSNSELAEMFQMTSDHLGRLFRKSEGMTLQEYVLLTRVNIAKAMLRYSECTLSQIADAVGFSSQSHFGSVFRKRVGQTPAEYRKKNKKIYRL